jgi:hypothetical protein
MGRAISIGGLQCEHYLPGTVECKAFVGHGGAGDIAAQVFEFLPLMGGAAHLGMEAKAVLVDTALWRGLRRLARDGLQAQHFLACPGPERNAVGAGRRLQGCQGAFRIGVGQVGYPLLCDKIALARQ